MRHASNPGRAVCAFIPVLILAASAPASAAAQAADTAGPATDTSAIPLAPIRVTVLRTPLRLAETPFAVTVERPEGTGPGLTLAEALGSVPGLQVDNRYNFSQGDRISVRGVGARAQFGVRGVKVLVDGIPATLPDGQTSLSHVDPRRIDRAEVVRGPASSLWGNAAGGVIQLSTAGPGEPGGPAGRAATGYARLEAEVSAGSHGLTHYGARASWSDGSAPAGPTDAGPGPGGFGLSASVSRLLYDGFRDHASADKRFASAGARWTGERDEVRVVAHGVAYEADNPGSLTTALLAEDPTQAYGFNVAQGTGEAARQLQAGLTWRRSLRAGLRRSPGDPEHLEDWSDMSDMGDLGGQASAGATAAVPGVLEVTGWVLTRDLDNPIPPVVIDLSRWAAGVRSSVRGGLELAGRPVEWVVGLDVEGQWDDRLNFENDGGDRGALVLDQGEAVTSVAPFAQASASVAGPVSVLAGLRYDRHRFTADDRLVSAGDPSTDDSGSRVMDQLSPSVGLTAELGRASLYGSVASSFETPTTTELVNRPDGGAGLNPALEPQRAWSVEAGLRLRGGRTRVHLSAYRTAIRGALIPFEDPGSPGRTFFRNAGSAVHRGLELDGWAALVGGLTGRLGLAWTDARFDRFLTQDGDFSGNRVPGVAPLRVSGELAWAARVARVALSARWVDAIPVNDGNTAAAPSYSLVDLRAAAPSLPLAGASIELFGGVDNVLDTDYIASVVVNAFGDRYYEPGPGRAVYLGVRVGR